MRDDERRASRIAKDPGVEVKSMVKGKVVEVVVGLYPIIHSIVTL